MSIPAEVPRDGKPVEQDNFADSLGLLSLPILLLSTLIVFAAIEAYVIWLSGFWIAFLFGMIGAHFGCQEGKSMGRMTIRGFVWGLLLLLVLFGPWLLMPAVES